ncbi:MAG: hypothetical protein KC713_00615 [Candidatus Omnitrophica bacterium]|nr:hypothetical protein [Candidatus Omnitrophota bacterium]
MAQQVQELIDKIKQEGIEQAHEKADQIIKDAEAKAQSITAAAQKKADELVAQANAETKKMQESTLMALKQASRDTILTLRNDLQKILQKIITQNVRASLSSEQLGQMLTNIVKEFLQNAAGEHGVEIQLSENDFNALKDHAIAKIQKELKDGISFQVSGQIAQGFKISFDQGKSSFDFTDHALAEYLASFLNEQIAILIKEAVE